MDKREEIREGLEIEIDYILGLTPPKDRETRLALVKSFVIGIQRFEDSQGVVIKVDRELPELGNHRGHNMCVEDAQTDILKAGYVAVEPLIEDKVDYADLPFD